MKKTTLSLMLGLGLVLIAGCNSSDDNPLVTPEVPPMPSTTISIQNTSTINVKLVSTDPDNGAVIVTLTGDEDKAIVGANAFNLLFMGYPTSGVKSTKYKLAWHQAQQSNCIDTAECTMLTDELKAGMYQLTLDDSSWKFGIVKYRVALEVKGDNAYYPMAFLN